MLRTRTAIMIAMAMLFATAPVQAATIIWVSDNKDPQAGVPRDQEWVDLLNSRGYTVDLSFRNAEAQTLDATKIAAFNAADLIIISRDTSSGSYDDGTEPTDWNGVTTPIIMQVAHIARSNRWLWLNTEETNNSLQNMLVVEPAHPTFKDVTIPPDNQLTVLNEASSFCNITDAGNGTLIASRADNHQVWIVFWARETEFYEGSGQFAAGARLFFAGGTNSGTDGRYNLTDDGQTIFLNAVEYMLSGDYKIRTARNPLPENGKQGVGRYDNFGMLQWTPGETAVWHNIYFGANPNPGPAEFKMRVPLQNAFYFPGREAATTYYWRIDEEEVDGTIHPGEVWWFSTASLKARSPIPADGANFVDPNTDLTWEPGFDATTHDVYFGTDATAVANATKDSDEYKGVQAATTFDLGSLELETSHYWRIDEVESAGTRKGNLWSFTTGTAKQGRILREIWRDITPTGNSVDLLRNWWKYPGQPNDSNFLTAFDSAQLAPAADEYGGRIHGWLHVPAPGDYTFWISADNNAELWLSTDDDPGNAVLIANVPGHSGRNEWTKYGEQKSATITLESEKYYIMALWKEGTGGDHCEVSWQGPASPTQTIIPGAYLSPYEALWAWSPDPSNGATGVSLNQIPTWRPGSRAVSHEIYFGADPDAVANATKASGEYKGTRLLGAESYDPGKLLWETSYYWRIDEVNSLNPESPWKGRVWSFTTSNYILVDDFEDYNDYTPDRIFEWWLDGFGYGMPPPSPGPYYGGNGTGSIVGYALDPFAETNIVHGGDQAMPYFFDNNLANTLKYSEATRTLVYPRNWTEEGVKALSLWFRGYPASEGGYDYDAGTGAYTVRGAGTDIWNVSDPRQAGYHDEFHFVYRTLNGPGAIQARVESVENTNGWAKAGVMIRDTLDANSVHSMVIVSPSNGVSWQYRMETGQSSTSTTVAGVTAPQWVRITRDVSATVTAEYSDDGFTWTTIGTPLAIPMDTPMYIGLALTSHNAGATCEAVFSNVSFPNTTPGGQWASQDIGIISNDPEKMYVAISNSNGASGVVYHPDPNAILTNTWTEWNIPLTEFSSQGVVLTDVNDIRLGFGTRGNATTPGGSGTAYFDDIRLYRGRCFPDIIKPAGDFSNSCVVDFPDVEIMVDNWLISDWQVTPTPTSTTGLLAHFQFDNAINPLFDSVGGYNADPCGTVAWTPAGKTGGAIDLDGTAYVDTHKTATELGVEGGKAKSVTAWVYTRSFNRGGIFDMGANVNGQNFSLRTTSEPNMWRAQRYGYPVYDFDFDYPSQNEWVHMALVYDGNDAGNWSYAYANGEQVGSQLAQLDTVDTRSFRIGIWNNTMFDGLIDDLRLYNRALSQAEVASLAGRSGAFTQPLHLLLRPQDPAIDMSDDGRIDFKDYAILTDMWLDELLWP